MSYENAPATAMLDIKCACCGRALVDAQSSEVAVGPICRKKYLIADAVSEEARVEGNKLINLIAREQTGPKVERAIHRLSVLGYKNVVARINKRIKAKKTTKPAVTLTYKDNRLHMTAFIGYGQWNAWLKAMRSVPGFRYEGQGKGNSFPKTQRAAVYGILCQYLPGRSGTGPKGDFIIGQ